MINRKTTTVIGFILAMGLMGDLYAQEIVSTKHDRRQKAQRLRIVDGVVDGDLTRREASALIKQQRVINNAEKRIEADGVVTRRERSKLNSLQARASRNITRQKKDSQVRRG